LDGADFVSSIVTSGEGVLARSITSVTLVAIELVSVCVLS
jgi:hypothetical protein